MEAVVNPRARTRLASVLLSIGLVPSVRVRAGRATAAVAAPAPAFDSSSRLWLVAGGAFATLRGDCQECEADYPYRHAGSLLVNVGYRVNTAWTSVSKLFWMPVDNPAGQIRTTHIDAVAQFRPWRSKGFFLKGGAGMAFVRNWVDVVSDKPIFSKALSVVIGTGWEFHVTRRVGFEVFAAQHAAALGDFQTPDATVQDVIGNFWSVGVALVIR